MRPTEIVFDLDPSNEDLTPVRAAAARLRDVLTDLGHQPRVKSSGSRGLHIHVTVDEANTFEETREFAYRVADTVIAGSDDRFTRAQRIAARRGRLFIDTLRNARAAHVVAPYSLRPLPEAPIAVPLHWAEALDPQFHPRRITIANIFRRLGHTDDPWTGSPAPGPSIHEGVEMLASR